MNPSAYQDLSHLKRSVEILGTITKSDSSYTYCFSLFKTTSRYVTLTTTVLENANLYKNHKKRRLQNDIEHPVNSPAMSTLISSKNAHSFEVGLIQSASESGEMVQCFSGTSDYIGSEDEKGLMEYFGMNSEAHTSDVDWTISWPAPSS